MSNYLVVGESQGLGYAVAHALHARGDDVVGLSRNPENKQVPWTRDHLDVSDLDAVEHWVSLYSEKSQDEPFSGVVMCHAKHGEKSGTQWKPDEWESYFRTNCTSVVSLIHHLDGWGCLTDECKIVIFGSFLQNGSANQPAYAASKAALWAWMRSYTMAQSAQDSRSVNMIWPARVNTPSNPARDLPDTDPNFFREPENLAEETLRLLDDDLGRRGTTIDVGRN